MYYTETNFWNSQRHLSPLFFQNLFPTYSFTKCITLKPIFGTHKVICPLFSSKICFLLILSLSVLHWNRFLDLTKAFVTFVPLFFQTLFPSYSFTKCNTLIWPIFWPNKGICPSCSSISRLTPNSRRLGVLRVSDRKMVIKESRWCFAKLVG